MLRLIHQMLTRKSSISVVFLIFLSSLALAQQITIDELDSGFSHDGPSQYWKRSSIGFKGGAYYTWTSDPKHGVTNSGTWTAHLGKAGKWRVEAYIPRQNGTSRNAHYTVRSSYGSFVKSINQLNVSDKYVSLGEYDFVDPNRASVTLDDMTGEGWGSRKIAFDAMRWTYLGAVTGPPPPPNGKAPFALIREARMVNWKTLEVACAFETDSFNDMTYELRVTFPNTSTPIPFKGNTALLHPIKNFRTDCTAYIYVDLSKYGPKEKYSQNVQFHLWLNAHDRNGDATKPDEANFDLLLPIIVVPGILPSSFGFQTGDDDDFLGLYSSFNEMAKSHARFSTWYVGKDGTQGYPDYPTARVLSYRRNSDTLQQASDKLKSLVDQTIGATYSNKVILLGHSRGGLVARYFTQMNDRGRSVSKVVTANTPHTGTGYVYKWGKLSDYPDLYPDYKGYDPNYGGIFSESPDNPDLRALNNASIPNGVQMLFLWSFWNNTTPYAAVDGNNGPLELLKGDGDGLVPSFSQQGYRAIIDPRSGQFHTEVVPSLKGVQKIYVGSHHHFSSYDEKDYQSTAFGFIFKF